MKTKLRIILSSVALLIFAAVGVQYGFAQTASTSDEVASTTDSAVASSTDPGPIDAASTTEADTATTTSDVATSISVSSNTDGPIVFSDRMAEATKNNIASLENAYFAKTAKYLQVLPGSKLPPYEDGTVAGNLGQDLPPNVRVDVYDAPEGSGYQIVLEQDGEEFSMSTGPEARDRSYEITRQLDPLFAAATASSTPVTASTTPGISDDGMGTTTASTTQDTPQNVPQASASTTDAIMPSAQDVTSTSSQ